MDIFESLENLAVSEACFNDIIAIIEEEVSDKDIKGARRRKLSRLETIGKSLDKGVSKAQKNLEQAKKNLEQAQNIHSPRANQFTRYLEQGRSIPKPLRARYDRTREGVQQAKQAEEEAFQNLFKASRKSSDNKRAQLRIYGVKDI